MMSYVVVVNWVVLQVRDPSRGIRQRLRPGGRRGMGALAVPRGQEREGVQFRVLGVRGGCHGAAVAREKRPGGSRFSGIRQIRGNRI